jgi:hypothetical protein
MFQHTQDRMMPPLPGSSSSRGHEDDYSHRANNANYSYSPHHSFDPRYPPHHHESPGPSGYHPMSSAFASNHTQNNHLPQLTIPTISHAGLAPGPLRGMYDAHSYALPGIVNFPGVAHLPGPGNASTSGAAGVNAAPVIHTDDAATKLSDKVRRRCFNCCTSDTSTWRRSNLSPGKVVSHSRLRVPRLSLSPSLPPFSVLFAEPGFFASTVVQQVRSVRTNAFAS